MDNLIINIGFIILGGLNAFFSAILTNLSQEQLAIHLQLNTKKSLRLQKLKTHHENATLSFILLEILFYVIAAILTGVAIRTFTYEYKYIIYSIFIFFLSIIFLRTLLYSLGKRFSKYLAYHIANLLYLLFLFANPLARVINFINKKSSGEQVEEASREELDDLLETAHEDGSIETDEYRILKNIMHFSDVIVSDVMTPRTVIFSCEANQCIADVLKLPEIKMYSRFPIWEGESLDDGVLGYVMTKDLLYAAISGKTSTKLSELAREISFIPENAELDVALETFLRKQQHIFLVVDEYGGIEGLITMEDVIETILGVEIVDEADKVVDLRELAKTLRNKRIKQMTSLSVPNSYND